MTSEDIQNLLYIVKWNDANKSFSSEQIKAICNTIDFLSFPKINTFYNDFRGKVLEFIRLKNEFDGHSILELTIKRDKLTFERFKQLELKDVSSPCSLEVTSVDDEMQPKIEAILANYYKILENNFSVSANEIIPKSEITNRLLPIFKYMSFALEKDILYFDRNTIYHYLTNKKDLNNPINIKYSQFTIFLSQLNKYLEIRNKKVKLRFITEIEKSKILSQANYSIIKEELKRNFKSYKCIDVFHDIYIRDDKSLNDHPRILILNYEGLVFDRGLNFQEIQTGLKFETIIHFDNKIAKEIRDYTESNPPTHSFSAK